MTENEIRRRFPNASASLFRANSEAPGAKPEPAVRHEPLAQAPREDGHTGRCSVSIVSYRQRLCDPDNLVGKYFLDALRYEGVIKDDTAALIEYSIRQEKVASKEDERTVIIITPL